MTAVNDELHNPVTGEHVRFLTVAFDRMRAEITVDPRAGGPPVHQHPIAAETFAVRSGRVRMRNGSHRTTLEAGQSITVAAGVRHGFWNDHDEPAVLIVEWERATRMAEFLEGRQAGAVADGCAARRVPRLDRVARSIPCAATATVRRPRRTRPPARLHHRRFGPTLT
jgi:mannose-6-phosphate isomerase-like protein (cupin superfamily)